MQFTTPLHIPSAPFQINHSDRLFMIGSCFADNMADLFRKGGMQVVNNPFGTLYNPLSISACIRRLIEGDSFIAEDLVLSSGMYHSMMHHGSFSSANSENCLQSVNQSVKCGREALLAADVIVVTFGTAWIYEMNGQIVGNCHKIDGSNFNRRRLSITEIVRDWTSLLQAPELADKKFIFTVSPIRHIKDGLHENQLSKATLLLSIDQIADSTHTYFPSYEILMDELRDYRFYAEDMIHPSEIAIRYIWNRFQETFFDTSGRYALSECDTLYRDLQHRPLHPEDPAYTLFCHRLEEKQKALMLKYPYLNI